MVHSKQILLLLLLIMPCAQATQNIKEWLKSFTKGAAGTTCAMFAGYTIGKQFDQEHAGVAIGGLFALVIDHHLGKNDSCPGIRRLGGMMPLVVFVVQSQKKNKKMQDQTSCYRQLHATLEQERSKWQTEHSKSLAKIKELGDQIAQMELAAQTRRAENEQAGQRVAVASENIGLAFSATSWLAKSSSG